MSHTMEQCEQLITSIATRQKQNYRMIEAEDLKQELRLYCWQNQQELDALLDPEQEPADYKAGCERARKNIRNMAERWCRREKANQLGYKPHDEQFYSIDLLRKLLPPYIDHGVTEHPPVDREASVGKGGGLPSETGNWQVLMLDLQRGMSGLSPADRNLLTTYYQEPDSVKAVDIAYKLGWTEDALHNKLRAALKRLQQALGGPNPWRQGPGTRKVVSNAQAQAELQDK